MAHKTLINGTAYNINGGLSMVEGTSYSVKNGKVLIDGTEYDINFLLPPGTIDLWSDSGEINVINSIAYANGYWVVGGGAGEDYGTASARIAYAKSLGGPWTYKDIWSADTGLVASIYSVVYANGYWVAGGIDGNGKAGIAYTTNLAGVWTTKELWDIRISPSQFCKFNIVYADGYWMFSGPSLSNGYSYGTIAYATNLTGNWTTKNLWSVAAFYIENLINCVTYANGYWVVGGVRKVSNNYDAIIAYASTPGGSWTIPSKLWNNTYPTNGVCCITYANGYWVVGGEDVDNNDNNMAVVAYTTDIENGDWTDRMMWSAKTGASIDSIDYANGYLVVGGYSLIAQGTSLARVSYCINPGSSWSWTTKNLWRTSRKAYPLINCVTYANGYWVVGGGTYSSFIFNAHLSYAPNPTDFIIE